MVLCVVGMQPKGCSYLSEHKESSCSSFLLMFHMAMMQVEESSISEQCSLR